MLIDLDRFKQVNDSFGHEYGDIVLLCFAKRLQVALQTYSTKDLELLPSRSGGEEFIVCVSGIMTGTVLEEVAEQIRSAIEKDVLPSNKEWEDLPSDRRPAAVRLPHPADRRVTASLGLSSIAFGDSKIDPRTRMNQLKAEADVALYRAKGGGRNTVRYFPNIKFKFGTVIQHHLPTDVVVIDIGHRVGVAVGQEFLVHHPDFSGNRDFVFSDGRTQRHLGKYPRRASGRLLVFDTQREISFCQIAERMPGGEFPEGSLLEFIPAGVITHLIESKSPFQISSAGRLTPIAEFEKEIETRSSRNDRFSVVVFVLRNILELEAAKGTSFVNQALAALYAIIETQYKNSARFSQIQPSQIAVLAELANAVEAEATARETLVRAKEACSNVAVFAAGLYCPIEQKNETKEEIVSELKSDHSLDYARYAASPQALGDTDLAMFSPALATTIVGRLRQQRAVPDAVADYERLYQLGLRDGRLDNQGALSYFESVPPNFTKARELINSAVTSFPSEPIFLANKALIEYACQDYVAANMSFRSLAEEYPQTVLPDVYLPAKAMAAFHARQWSDGSSRKEVSDLIRSAMEITRSPTNLTISPIELQKALVILESSGN